MKLEYSLAAALKSFFLKESTYGLPRRVTLLVLALNVRFMMGVVDVCEDRGVTGVILGIDCFRFSTLLEFTGSFSLFFVGRRPYSIDASLARLLRLVKASVPAFLRGGAWDLNMASCPSAEDPLELFLEWACGSAFLGLENVRGSFISDFF